MKKASLFLGLAIGVGLGGHSIASSKRFSHSHPKHHTRCSAVTLVELIVAIAILGVLAALLLPSLRRMQVKAGDVKCASNLRQLIGAWQHYCGDNDGFSVPYFFNTKAYYSAEVATNDPNSLYTGWISNLLPYLGGNNIDGLLICPSASKPSLPVFTKGTAHTAYAWNNGNRTFTCSYGMNARWYIDIAASGFYKKILEGNGTEGPVFSDATWLDFQRGAPPADFDAGLGCGMVRHKNKGVHMAFADGSVRLVTMGELYGTLIMKPGEIINPAWISSVPLQYR